MMKVYLSGPMRGLPEHNYPAFHAAERILLTEQDVEAVVNPATFHPQSAAWKDCIPYDLERLKECDAIAFLEGWENSQGARIEAAFADGAGIALYYKQGHPFTPHSTLPMNGYPPRDARQPARSSDARFDALLAEIGELHDRKMADYGKDEDPLANVKASEDFGIVPWVGAMVRGNDKMRRIQKFARSSTLKNESVEDSLLDLATYSLIALQLFRDENA